MGPRTSTESTPESKGASIEELAEQVKSARSLFAKDLERIKQDLEFACAPMSTVWEGDDGKAFGTDRACVRLPLIGTLIDRATATYSASPYGIAISPFNSENLQKAILLQSVVRGIETRSSARSAYRDALRLALACGCGYLHAYTVDRGDGMVDVRIESLQNPTAVVVDQTAVKPDASDAEFIAFCSKMGKEKARKAFDDEEGDVTNQENDLFFDIMSGSYDHDTEVPVVTIYRMEEVEKEKGKGRQAVLYKVVGNKIVDRNETELSYLPIVRVTGVPVWTKNSRWSWAGIGNRAEGVQRMANFAASQMTERLALSPKANYIASKDAVKSNFRQWANSSRTNPSVLTYKDYDEKTKRVIPMPQKQDTAVNLGDVSSVITGALNLLGATTGVDGAFGPGEGPGNMTAEEVLTRSRNAESVLSGIYEALGDAVRQLGRVLVSAVAVNYGNASERDVVDQNGQTSRVAFSSNGLIPTEYEVDIDAGPLMASQRKDNVRQLTALMQAAPQLATAIVPAIVQNLDIDDGEQVVQAIAGTASDPAEAERLKAENEQLKAELNATRMEALKLQASMRGKLIDSRTKLATAQMSAENAMNLELLKQQAISEREAAQIASREEIEGQKLEADLLKEQAKAEAEIPNYITTPY
jgi:hypothetical protein